MFAYLNYLVDRVNAVLDMSAFVPVILAAVMGLAMATTVISETSGTRLTAQNEAPAQS